MLEEEENNASLNDKKKLMWVHKCFRHRKSEGEYWTRYKKLADDEIKFYRYFRMTKHQLSASENWKRFEKEDYHLPEAISPMEKLATCLR